MVGLYYNMRPSELELDKLTKFIWDGVVSVLQFSQPINVFSPRPESSVNIVF